VSRCDVCMRDVDDGVSCGECCDTDFYATHGEQRAIAAVVAMLREAPRAGGVLLSIGSSQDIARLADAIERGDWRVYLPQDPTR
jgi:hypothetical protein